MHQVDAPFDLVVSTNGGYPLDRNLYQAVKGMAAAERIVRDGGSWSWRPPARTGYRRTAPSPACFTRRACRPIWPTPSGGAELDRWQAQVLGRVLARADVYLHCDGLDPGDRRGPACSRPAPDLSRRGGDGARATGTGGPVAVLPEGPLTVAGVAGPA